MSAVPDPDLTEDATTELSTSHLARFEFSDAGTKILMVEWAPGAVASTLPTAPDDAPSPATPAKSNDWHVSWPGKSTVLPANDVDSTSSVRRIFFLLPPDAPVPSTVTITPPSPLEAITLKPLPAIFPPSFQDQRGTRGVLHTIWAKKRLRELDAEMASELSFNTESVGLEMARAERDWIVDTFLTEKKQGDGLGSVLSAAGMTPLTPRSPIGGKLGEKLHGLKLGTSPAELEPSANIFLEEGSQSQTLSPRGDDIAMSGFGSIPQRSPGVAPMGGAISLNAVIKGDPAPTGHKTEDDDLFALPISPRSPDMAKSPFSTLK